VHAADRAGFDARELLVEVVHLGHSPGALCREQRAHRRGRSAQGVAADDKRRAVVQARDEVDAVPGRGHGQRHFAARSSPNLCGPP